MSNLPSLQPLAEHRQALLLAEVAAWLHMLGKLHENFLAGKHSLATQIPQDIPDGLKDLLQDTWISKFWVQLGISELQSDNLSIASIIASHQTHNAKTGFERLMWDAHGRGSGTEKGQLERFFPGQEKKVFLSTAFGYEPAAPIDLQAVEKTRKELYAFLEQNLVFLKARDGEVDWYTFRQSFLSRIETAFRLSVAETRHPINDVTLFDQTFASVAFFKAALAQIVLRGWNEPNQKDVADKYHWRILRVGLDGLRFWGQAARLNDLLSRKDILRQTLDAVKTLLEVTYPLGMEMYRDENGSLFIVPDVENLLECHADGRPLRDHLQEIAHGQLTSEAALALELSPRTRNMLSFGRMATQELPPPAPSPDWLPELDQLWRRGDPQDICPVCGLRPQGPDPKSLERKVCWICEQRRSDRSKAWVHEMDTTIWTNEVVDTNGKMALIAGRFDLKAWLTGENFNTVAAFEPSSRDIQYEKRGKNFGPHPFSYQKMLDEIQQLLSSNQQIGSKETPLLNFMLPESYQRNGRSFAETYAFYAQDADLGEKKPSAHLFALALMRQQPSPARLRRVWETTRTFWQEVQGWAFEHLSDDRRRLKIYLSDAPKDLGPYHVYDLQLGETELDVVWVPPQNGQDGYLLTADNLGYIACRLEAPKEIYPYPDKAAIFVENYLKEQFINKKQQPVLLNPDASVTNRPKNLLQGIFIRELAYQENRYAPTIPILAEPRSFMMIVPADKVLDIVNHVYEKYQHEMGKVRNRLPLHLGIVFADRRMPLMAVLDAGRAMLKRTPDDGPWTVTKTDRDLLSDGKPRCVRLTLARDGHEIGIEIPTVMGDNKTFDPWYPYWRAGQPTDRRYWFIGPDGEHWVHVSDLRSDDTVYFTPSTFDFEYLDSASRRFAIAYENGRRCDRPTRPYLLEDLERLETVWAAFCRLSQTQRKQVLQTIETARERWFGRDEAHRSASDPVFRRFVADTLANAQWDWKKIENHEQLITAAVRGELADLAELHQEILKEK
jgi:CRISPR-associated Csx11 family protein